MLSSLVLVLSFAVSTTLAGKFPHRATGLRPKHARHWQSRTILPRNETQAGPSFKLVDLYQGEDFLDQWDFFTGPDPTHGLVNFQNKDDALKKNLAAIDNGTAVFSVDDFTDLPVGANRDSIRIQSKKTYTKGLFIADFEKMPHGCSVWPAWWSVGPNWPTGGEIDVLEGVHLGPTNSYTLHTSPGCTLGQNEASSASSRVVTTKCESSGLDNRGCAFSDKDPKSYGHEFNVVNGGVFAHQWDSTGIRIWRFSRGNIPQDIQDKQPNPLNWGKPAALFGSSSCDIDSHFFQHNLVIDTTLCGDLGNPTFGSSGCPGTCEQAVAKKENFIFAKWRINYIAVYDQ